jgi:hypothetical protein
MPGALGTSVVEYARSHLRDVPIAVITGSPDLAPAGTQVFTKPLHVASLLDFVRPHLGESGAH